MPSENQTVSQVVTGAWLEAIEAQGLERVYLVILVGALTIPFFPVWILLWALEQTGHYDVDGGFSL